MDPFIVYTSNVFVILDCGRSILPWLIWRTDFTFSITGWRLSWPLWGVKMLLVDVYKIPIGIALSVVAGILLLSVLASLVQRQPVPADPHADEMTANRWRSG